MTWGFKNRFQTHLVGRQECGAQPKMRRATRQRCRSSATLQCLRCRDLLGLAGLLVAGEDVDAALVPLLFTPGLVEEGVDKLENLVLGVLTPTDRQDLRIVVGASKASGVLVPAKGATCLLYTSDAADE